MLNHLRDWHPNETTDSFRFPVPFQQLFHRGKYVSFEIAEHRSGYPTPVPSEPHKTTANMQKSPTSVTEGTHSLRLTDADALAGLNGVRQYTHAKNWERLVKSVDWIEPSNSGSLLAFITM